MTGAFVAAGASAGADNGFDHDTLPPSLTAFDTATMRLGMRPGIWSLRVWKPGYQPWRRDGIVVPDSTLRCPTPRTVRLTAWLVRTN